MAFYFRLPLITDLTIEQQAVLSEPGAIAVSGGPGTGKSVVALWRHIRNHDTGKRKSLLLTYTMSLEAYLKASASSENTAAGSSVNRTYYWTYHYARNNQGTFNEIIIDEAQDVSLDKYQTLQGCAEMVSYSADDNQMLFQGNGVSESELQSLFTANNFYQLHQNFRNTNEIVHFVRSMFPNRLISSGNTSGPKPTIVCSDGNNDIQINIVKEIIKEFGSSTHNIAILVPLQNDVTHWYDIISSSGIVCSKFINRDGDMGEIENVHITTFKSAKGLEFDTVILPNFNKYESNLQRLHVVEENDYYVVFTRSRRNLILIDNSMTNDGMCNLSFLEAQIQRKIINVDYNYISKKSTSASQNEMYEDDLPF